MASQEFNLAEQVEWANTPLGELPKLSDMEYFQRNLIKGLRAPSLSDGNHVLKSYVDAQVQTDSNVGDILVNLEYDEANAFDNIFAFDGAEWVQPSLDLKPLEDIDWTITTSNKPEDGIMWVGEFSMFDINLVSDPIQHGCTLQLTSEERYDRAMNGL